METDEMTLRQFVRDRLEEDDERAARGELPQLDDAERRGLLRIVRADEGGLLLIPGAPDVRDDHEPVPFTEKAPLLRQELDSGIDDDSLRLLASAYDTHHGWQEEWRI